MESKVSLQAVVQEMDVLSEEEHAYLNRNTGELVTLGAEEIAIVEEGDDNDEYPDWQQEMIRKAREVFASDDYLQLPSKHDIHEYAIMERFCLAFEDENLSNDLLHQIRGRGAFRRFRDALHRHDIVEEWHQFRQAALEAIAVDWLEANNIPYTRAS